MKIETVSIQQLIYKVTMRLAIKDAFINMVLLFVSGNFLPREDKMVNL